MKMDSVFFYKRHVIYFLTGRYHSPSDLTLVHFKEKYSSEQLPQHMESGKFLLPQRGQMNISCFSSLVHVVFADNNSREQ